MRIKLKEGKQKELINEAKKNHTWKELSKRLTMSKDYVRLDIKKEKVLLSEENYKKLCNITGKNYDNYITEKLEDVWGKSKGGLNSPGSTIKLITPKNDERLAEFIGAVLGDGNLNYYKRGGEVGVYQVKIAGDYKKDKEYHLNYLKNLCESIFNLKVREIINQVHGERFLVLYSKELIEFFMKMGILPGNKIKNQVTIPQWIFDNKLYLKVCIRGLIDTDGSIFRMSKKDPNLIRLNFKNNNCRLLKDTRNAFIKLGFHPSNMINGNVFYISRQQEIKKYIEEIGFKNQKHLLKLPEFGIAL